MSSRFLPLRAGFVPPCLSNISQARTQPPEGWPAVRWRRLAHHRPSRPFDLFYRRHRTGRSRAFPRSRGARRSVAHAHPQGSRTDFFQRKDRQQRQGPRSKANGTSAQLCKYRSLKGAELWVRSGRTASSGGSGGRDFTFRVLSQPCAPPARMLQPTERLAHPRAYWS
jgi:hypothetical protein